MTIEPFVFEEQDRIVTSSSSFDQALGIFSSARKYNVPAGRVRIYCLDALGMEGTAFDPAAASHAHDHGIRPGTVAAPSQRRNLVTHLHKTRPRIVGELNFYDRLVTTDRHAARNSDDAGFRQRRVLNAIRKLIRQSAGDAE